MHGIPGVVRPGQFHELAAYGLQPDGISVEVLHDFPQRTDRVFHELAKVLQAERREQHGAAPEERRGKAGGGQSLLPAMYDYPWDRFALRLVGCGLMMNESWWISITFFSNVPYWSIAFEAWYYVIFALATFVGQEERLLVISNGAFGERIELPVAFAREDEDGRLVGEEGGGHQWEGRVLGAVDPDAAEQATSTINNESVHAHPFHGIGRPWPLLVLVESSYVGSSGRLR